MAPTTRAHADGTAQRLTADEGYCGLGATIASLGLASTEPVEVDVAACAPKTPDGAPR